MKNTRPCQARAL